MQRLFIGAVFLLPSLAYAILEQVPFNCDNKTCFFTLPVLQFINGWHVDRGQNKVVDATVLVPDGYTLESAEYVITARALYKPLLSDNPSLAHFIAQDKNDFVALYPGISISAVKSIISAAGINMPSLILRPKINGKWEQVTYADESQHFIVFTLTAKTESAFKQAQPAYYEILSKYH